MSLDGAPPPGEGGTEAPLCAGLLSGAACALPVSGWPQTPSGPPSPCTLVLASSPRLPGCRRAPPLPYPHRHPFPLPMLAFHWCHSGPRCCTWLPVPFLVASSPL